MENTPLLKTDRLILRRFTVDDTEDILLIYGDNQVNEFLPMFPLETLEQAELFLKENYLSSYHDESKSYRYAVCLKQDDIPIGYVNVSGGESHDFGYGLCKEFWHKGIITEASRAVIEQLKADGLSYITATHDRNNPRSGGVMQNVGMKYCYTYEELWQPKNFLVHFRMYQLNLDGCIDRVYNEYRDHYQNYYIEENLS